MSIVVYGIPNCDTVKKARTWLADHNIAFTFHDFKKQGLTEKIVAGWLLGADRTLLVNRKGTTWRALSAAEQAAVVDDASAAALMLAHTSVVKRPVLVLPHGAAQRVQVGFSDAAYRVIFDLPPA